MINSISQVREQVQSLYGKDVNFVINKGRNKIVKVKGTVEQVYPSMFVIKTEKCLDLDRLSYSYNDVLCGDIKLLYDF